MSADAHTVTKIIQENAENTQAFMLVIIFLCFLFVGGMVFANWKREQAFAKILSVLEEQNRCVCYQAEDLNEERDDDSS